MDAGHRAGVEDPLAWIGGQIARSAPFLVVAPPRSCSTAFARALAEHPRIRGYLHEPCGGYYYQRADTASLVRNLQALEPGFLVKEMTFQLCDARLVHGFFHNVAAPIVFLVRHPRLTLESRIRMVLADLAREPERPAAERAAIQRAIEQQRYAHVGELLDPSVFPLERTGWTDVAAQLALCRSEGIEHVIVDATSFRASPARILAAVCERMGLSFHDSMLRWNEHSPGLSGALPEQGAWYSRVLSSAGVLAPSEPMVEPGRLPPRFREHLGQAERIYEDALADPRQIG